MNDQTYQLVVRKGPRPGHVYSLTGSAMTIGRDPLADIVIDDPKISRQHARLTLTDSGYQVQDLGSTNGTYVDGKRLAGETVALRNGQLLMTGSNVTMAYEVISAAADPMATMVAPAGMPFLTPEPMPEPAPMPEPEPLHADATAMYRDPIMPSPATAPLPSFDEGSSAPLPTFDEGSSAPLPTFEENKSSSSNFGSNMGSGTTTSGSSGGVGGMLNGPNRNIIIGVVVAIIVLCCCCLPVAYYAVTTLMASTAISFSADTVIAAIQTVTTSLML